MSELSDESVAAWLADEAELDDLYAWHREATGKQPVLRRGFTKQDLALAVVRAQACPDGVRDDAERALTATVRTPLHDALDARRDDLDALVADIDAQVKRLRSQRAAYVAQAKDIDATRSVLDAVGSEALQAASRVLAVLGEDDG